MSEIYSVEVPGASYPCSKYHQTHADRSELWQLQLKKAHGQPAKCLCHGKGARQLYIRHLKVQNRYVLAKFANTGPEHVFNCRFFSEAEHRTGLGAYVDGVVVENDDDDVTVRLSQAIQIRVKKDDAEPKADLPFDPRKPGRTQRAMKLLGLLHLLWTRGGLNNWFPNMEGKRDDSILQWRLKQTAEHIKTHRMTLENVLLCPSKEGPKAGARNFSIVKKAHRLKYRLVTVGVLTPYQGDESQLTSQMPTLSLMNSEGMPTMHLDGLVWAQAQKSFNREIKAWEKGAKIIAIAFLNLREKPRESDVLEVALMRVSDMLIPLDSGLEGKVESMLREQKRKFSKPLRFDNDDKTIPDFWLKDLDDEFPMEVFGMNTPEYLQHKADKITYYNAEYSQNPGWWFWDVYQNSDLASALPLPAATR